MENPEKTKPWYFNSEHVALLSVSNEAELVRLINKLQSRGITISIFREPCINNEITAIAVESSKDAQRLCSGLPLAMREYDKKQVEALSCVAG